VHFTEQFLFAARFPIYGSEHYAQHIHSPLVSTDRARGAQNFSGTASIFSFDFYSRNHPQATATTRKRAHGFCRVPQRRKTDPYNRIAGAITHRNGGAPAQKNEVIL
jgi:hypothetical protein